MEKEVKAVENEQKYGRICVGPRKSAGVLSWPGMISKRLGQERISERWISVFCTFANCLRPDATTAATLSRRVGGRMQSDVKKHPWGSQFNLHYSQTQTYRPIKLQ
ncbi:hypothetical protein LOAG_03845 [Loa loa]|uniref:Uncharacterized protein n=1 Tax=Loa loa TaxID=7209 RepID=A0A1S0U5G1_LOALO|nr:hypothetical protein LOAG_03845 [Loa loa]EFO24638.1 hypothetical protein LOAG_03845 [Loa loa]